MGACFSSEQKYHVRKVVTREDVKEAQDAWAAAIVKISSDYANKGDYVALAISEAEKLYGYDHGQVLFKPTKAADVPFRPRHMDAYSYFVGHNAPESRTATRRTKVLPSTVVTAGRLLNSITTISRAMVRLPSLWAPITSPAQRTKVSPKLSIPSDTSVAAMAKFASAFTIHLCLTRHESAPAKVALHNLAVSDNTYSLSIAHSFHT